MPLELRPFASLGSLRLPWLHARYHFSFAGYHDPARMGVGPLRVWNDDEIAPHSGFDPHPHRDMEIVTWVREGTLTHSDSLGNQERLRAGDVQVMTAGAGIVHAEYNRGDVPVRLFQIWIRPDRRGLAPRYAVRRFPEGLARGRLVSLASGRPGQEGALPIHADATLFGAALDDGAQVVHRFDAGRRGYLVPASGRLRVNGIGVGARDGLVVQDEEVIVVEASGDASFLLADLP